MPNGVTKFSYSSKKIVLKADKKVFWACTPKNIVHWSSFSDSVGANAACLILPFFIRNESVIDHWGRITLVYGDHIFNNLIEHVTTIIEHPLHMQLDKLYLF